MASTDNRSEVLLVGAGILGLAIARELLTQSSGLTLTVLEKEAAIAQHQTGHNSGVIHSGIYYAPGSLKAELCVEGSRRMYEFCSEKGIPTERCGKVIVAADESEVPRLEELKRRGEANGVPGLVEVGPNRLAELEPNVTGVRALHSPDTGIVDFKLVARALADEVVERGGRILTGHAVTGISSNGGGARVSTSRGEFSAGRLVTCAGLQSDRLAVMTGAPPTPRIVPFRGTYYALSERARSLVNGLVYPVPDPAFPFLGVHFTKQISGEMWAGPNAVLAFAREGYRLRDLRRQDLWETLSYRGFRRMVRRYWRTGVSEAWGEVSKRAFVKAMRKQVPAVGLRDLGTRHAGVRAQAVAEDGTLLDDFWLDEAPNVTHIRNAPSPAATSSLALARRIVDAIGDSA
ncbi:MAG TPA: L-2-hydroxyglutarate oxidase [Gaiellaceae bacterium]|nr:L-2-hydroxyglutarate oxidase [Gaiellaceae bacterium]